MNKTIIEQYYNKLLPLVTLPFEQKLLKACFDSLADTLNELRFNNFACGIRELSRHFLSTLAPDLEVQECCWYKNETNKKGQISRGERVQYAVQGGIPEVFIEDNVFKIDGYKKPVLQCIELLNKYTHVGPKTFGLPDAQVIKLSGHVVDAFSNFALSIQGCRNKVIEKLEAIIDDAIVGHSIRESNDSIDILSTHHSIDELYVEHVDILLLKSKEITIEASGTIEVRQQWGSNYDLAHGDGHETNTSFPFASAIRMEITETFPDPDELEVLTFDVNTDSWYE